MSTYAQLGFCPGSKGEPIFTENFGNGTTYGPALPAGTTTYTFVSGAPNDGQYTLFYHSGLYSTWHYSLDHSPDITDGPRGKMLNVNANAVTSGDFYKKTISGLCVNTTFEFSAWVMNVYNPLSGFCGANEIPINVRFEIWNSDETILLGSGNTGNIMGTATPIWQQFALVFTTVSQTSVVLKMKNNGVGGCGNDLAIDDISFSACGDLTTVSSPSVIGTTYTTCTNPTALQLNAATVSAVSYFYQWQTSTDGVTWTNIAGANNATYNTPNLSTQTYFRVKAAQDLANLSNSFCSTASNVFTVSVLPAPDPPVGSDDQVICSGDPIPALSVTTAAGTNVNWYSAATGGTLLLANSLSYTPTAAGTFYAEAYNSTTNCIGSPRTAVKLTVVPVPTATIFGTTSICGGNTAVVNFSGTPNAIVTYTINGGINQNITLNASGLASITTPVLTNNSTYTLVSCMSPILNTCSRLLSGAAVITVNNSATASISSNSQTCTGSTATVNFIGTANATVTYSVNGATNQTIALNAAGTASLPITNITSNTNIALIDVSLSPACTQTLSQSITITVVPIPTAIISANPLAICANQTSAITFTGTPNGVVTYKINGGTNQSITLNAAGSASITTAALTSNSTYTLVGIVSSALNTCTNTLSDSVTITVSPTPTAAISSNSPICNGASATVNFTGTPNAVVRYTANGSATQSITLSAAGSASVVLSNVTATVVYNLVDVTSAGANGCTKTIAQSITIVAIPILTATIAAAPSSICANQTSTLNFTGTPNAVVTYTSGSVIQSVTLNASGVAIVVTPQLSANTTYQLINISLLGCIKPLSGSVLISINPIPNIAHSGNLNYCEGEPIAIAFSSPLIGTTFSYTVIQNGTTGATAGSGNQITQTVTLANANTGTVTYVVTPFYNGCAGNPKTIIVTIQPLPIPAITDGVICLTGRTASSQFYTLDTNLNAADHTFQWFFEGSEIPNATGNTYNANEIGPYTVIATSTNGCISNPVNAVVSERLQGDRLIIQQSEAFSENPSVIITVVGGDGPFYYQLDDAPFQSSNIFQNITAGVHNITVVDDYCTNLTSSVILYDYPKYFTPNADGYNDTWNIKGIDGAVIRIFDRYGKLLKQISSNGLGWNGTYNGRAMPATDYWFTIDYTENGALKNFKAHFSVKR